MIIKELDTFDIHYLTRKQYDREKEAGRIDENAVYLILSAEEMAERLAKLRAEEEQEEDNG